jgi:hypothetical protein
MIYEIEIKIEPPSPLFLSYFQTQHLIKPDFYQELF